MKFKFLPAIFLLLIFIIAGCENSAVGYKISSFKDKTISKQKIECGCTKNVVFKNIKDSTGKALIQTSTVKAPYLGNDCSGLNGYFISNDKNSAQWYSNCQSSTTTITLDTTTTTIDNSQDPKKSLETALNYLNKMYNIPNSKSVFIPKEIKIDEASNVLITFYKTIQGLIVFEDELTVKISKTGKTELLGSYENPNLSQDFFNPSIPEKSIVLLTSNDFDSRIEDPFYSGKFLDPLDLGTLDVGIIKINDAYHLAYKADYQNYIGITNENKLFIGYVSYTYFVDAKNKRILYTKDNIKNIVMPGNSPSLSYEELNFYKKYLDKAFGFLKASNLNINDSITEFYPKDIYRDNLGFTHVKLQRRIKNIIAENSELIVHFDKDDKPLNLISGGNQYNQVSDINRITSISEKVAISNALSDAKKIMQFTPDIPLSSFRLVSPQKLPPYSYISMYKIDIANKDGMKYLSSPQLVTYFIDTRTGEIIKRDLHIQNL